MINSKECHFNFERTLFDQTTLSLPKTATFVYRQFLILEAFGEKVFSVFVGQLGEDELLDDVVVLAQAHQDGEARVQVGRIFRVYESVQNNFSIKHL